MNSAPANVSFRMTAPRWALLLSTLCFACGDSTGVTPVTSVVITSLRTSLRVGESVQLTAAALDASGAVVRGATVRWTSSATSVASVTSAGVVTALAPGETNVSASVGTVSGSLDLTVTPTGGAIVSMPGFSFVPFTTTINVGGTVTWDFPAEPHNVIFARVTGAPTDILITSNRSVSRTFPIAGSFNYDCTLHPGMSGIVVAR